MSGRAGAVIIAVFLLAIFVPLAMAVPGAFGSGGGARKAISAAAFRGWYEKSFGMRDLLVRAHAVLKLRVLGVSSNRKNVIKGRDGWFYYTDENITDYYRAAYPMTTGELEKWRAGLEQTRDSLAARGIQYIFFIAPNKQTIYPDYFPASLNRINPQTRLEQLVDYMRAQSGYRMPDLRDALRGGRADGLVYSRTDTHWTSFGAYLAYAEIMREVGLRYTGAGPRPLSEFHIRQVPMSTGGLARMLGLGGRMTEYVPELVPLEPRRAVIEEKYAEGDVRIVVSRCPGAELPRAVVFHDSFMNAMIPFLAEHFRMAVFVHKSEFDTRLVDEFRPNIVIEEMVERIL